MQLVGLERLLEGVQLQGEPGAGKEFKNKPASSRPQNPVCLSVEDSGKEGDQPWMSPTNCI
jgi:hypothetical protein